MSFRPLYDRIAVRQTEVKTTSEAGILLMSAAEAPLQGEIVAVGGGAYDDTGNIQIKWTAGNLYAKVTMKIWGYA